MHMYSYYLKINSYLAGKRGNLFVGKNVPTTMCPLLPGPEVGQGFWETSRTPPSNFSGSTPPGMTRVMVVHVCYKPLYISLSSSAKQQRVQYD